MPEWKQEIRRRLVNLKLEPTREAAIVEELSQHLDDCYAELLASGATEAEAERRTLAELSEHELLARELRRVKRQVAPEPTVLGTNRRTNMIADLWQDLRFGARMLIKNSGFTLIVVITLALGIGANTAIFSVVNGVLLKSLPYREPEQLIRVFERSQRQPKFPLAQGNFQDYREQNSTLSGLALYMRQDLELSRDERPERLAALRITAGFFELLGVQPLLGREFRREDELPDNNQVVLLSHGLWRRRFNTDPNIIGQAVTLSGRPFTVVGVLPPGVQHVGGDYRSTPHGESVDVWWPIGLQPQAGRGAHFCNGVGRLKPGVTRAQAETDLNAIASRLAQQFPNTNRGWSVVTQPLHEEIVGRARAMLLVLFGAVFFVLLIVCVNVANLLLARATVREREIAARAALGAGRWRIVRQLLTESLLLATVGGAAGISLAQWIIAVFGRLGAEQLPRLHAVSLDGPLLLSTLALTLLTGVLFGLAPALQAGQVNLNELLKEGGRSGASGRQRRLRDALVIALPAAVERADQPRINWTNLRG